ncbi:MAG: aminotransferase class III-fold pyridoxal phosphate-dependent enzyme [Sphingomonadales bacterium]|nr:MAG: aminotransferase class III-fold pyridoxal phosphate-dependent enzyme [Sphingomonadales bacterium]
MAGGVNSNVRLGQQPLCFASASGSKLIDLDGNEYVDYALGMGPTILGHAPAHLIEAVGRSLGEGQLFAGQHSSELELATLLQECIPSAELVRIGMTGSEMVQAALRVARAHTGRRGFIKFEGQYHGWFDNVLVNQAGPPGDPSAGLPFPVRSQTPGQAPSAGLDTFVLPWNDADAVATFLETHGSEVAALITEPVMCNAGVIAPRPGYLEALRALCDQHGVVLIFDEVITGFRIGLGGAQGHFGVRPDLSTFAKAFGGGFPVAAITGRRDLMEMFANGVNHSGTYNSNLVSIVAGIATLEELKRDGGAVYGRIEATGNRLMTGIREIAARHAVNLKVTGFGAAFHTQFTDETDVHDYASYSRGDADLSKRFIDALLLKGIRPTARGTWFVSAAHDDSDVERTLAAIDAVLADLGEIR